MPDPFRWSRCPCIGLDSGKRWLSQHRLGWPLLPVCRALSPVNGGSFSAVSAGFLRIIGILMILLSFLPVLSSFVCNFYFFVPSRSSFRFNWVLFFISKSFFLSIWDGLVIFKLIWIYKDDCGCMFWNWSFLGVEIVLDSFESGFLSNLMKRWSFSLWALSFRSSYRGGSNPRFLSPVCSGGSSIKLSGDDFQRGEVGWRIGKHVFSLGSEFNTW